MVTYYFKKLLFSTVSDINSQSSPKSETIRRRVSRRGLTLYKISLACQYTLSHHDTTHVIPLLGQRPPVGHRFLRSQFQIIFLLVYGAVRTTIHDQGVVWVYGKGH